MKKIFVYPILGVMLSSVLGACAAQTAQTPELKNEQATEMKKGTEATEINSAHWSYEGETSPEHWGDLDPVNSACVNGNEQSPINIEFSQVANEKGAEDLQINYKLTSFSLMNNGHTVQANTASGRNSILIKGKEYKLAQFHFHTPSEHQFNGQNYEMELHLVHKDEDGKIAVLGVMIQEGEENKNLAAVWGILPKEETEKDIFLKEPVNLKALLPEDRTAFHYDGSLTTPPCTEEVKWTVFEMPIEMSKEQIEAFRQIFPDDHRPVQSLNNRKVIKS
ncbi:carbonic anhydrase [Bacillus salipaludis]|uniref:carbonic anhydrase n=1 Tax=Bacillus salipaludis TaxID=2547811 RepID=UPI002E1D4950|nr:carbonic anhydrase [Bacillus salipaludis]